MLYTFFILCSVSLGLPWLLVIVNTIKYWQQHNNWYVYFYFIHNDYSCSCVTVRQISAITTRGVYIIPIGSYRPVFFFHVDSLPITDDYLLKRYVLPRKLITLPHFSQLLGAVEEEHLFIWTDTNSYVSKFK